jgi:hypothetical protein
MVWSLVLMLALGGCWGRRRHRAPRTKTVDSPEPVSQSYDPPPPPPSPPPPTLPPPPAPPTARAEEPLSSERPATLVSRFRSTRSNRCNTPKGYTGETFSVQRVDPSDVLNVRVEPDWKSDIVGKLAPDMRGVIPLGERQRVGPASWRKVACGTVRGWVNEKFLERETDAK